MPVHLEIYLRNLLLVHVHNNACYWVLFWFYVAGHTQVLVINRPGSLVGCVSDWHSGSCGIDPQVPQHSFMEIGHEVISLPAADSSRAVVGYWRKDMH